MPNAVRSTTLRRIALLMVMVLFASMLGVAIGTSAPSSARAAQDPTMCQDTVGLVNGGFEEPAVAANNYATLPEDNVPGWDTNDSRNRIEIWSDGFNGVPAAEGTQFAELNAYSAGRLYQTVSTTPGQTLSWSLKHRGRNGTDVMRVLIGPPGEAEQAGPELSDGQEWGTHTGTYVVPEGQTSTTFAFEAVSSSDGNVARGNLLDDISFGTGPCLVSDKAVENLTSGGDDAQVGDILRYTVTTSNGGGNPAVGAEATDTLAPGLDYVPGSLQIVSGPGTGSVTDATGDDRGEYDSPSRTVSVRLGQGATSDAGGNVAAGSTTTYTFDARVNVEAANSTIENEAQVSFYDEIIGEDRVSTTSTTQTTVGSAADLEVTKVLGTDPVVAGEPVTFTVTGTNHGPQAASEVSLDDTLPEGLSDVEVTSTAGDCTSSSTTVSCSGLELDVDETVELTVTGTLSASATPGSGLVNTARIDSATTDPDRDNNIATAAGTVTTAGDVSVTKSYDPAEPVAGDEVTYTIEATNSGPSEARDVVLTDPLDPATSFVSASSDAGECTTEDAAVICDVDTLAPGESVTATVTVTLDPDAEVAVQNTATITSSTSDTDASNNASSTSFEPSIVSDLALSKTASVDTVSAGDSLTYTVDVTNNGPSSAENAVLTDTLPDGFSIGEVAAVDGGVCTVTAPDVRCTWDALEPGATTTVTLEVTVDPDAPAGAVINTAAVASPADDADETNNSGSATVVVEQEADVAVEKSATPNPGVPGTEEAYTVTVTNNGPSMARGATVTDALPTGFTDAVVDDEDCTIASGTLSCLFGDLEPGASRTITLTGSLDPDLTGTLSNTAQAASATPDPNPDNNASTVDIPLEPTADVSVSKSTSTPEVALDGTVHYEVTVINDGPSTATGVVVTDTIDDGIVLTGAETSTGTWSGRTWAVGDLAPGTSATITIDGVAHAEGTFTNTATASADTPDPDAEDLVDTADVTVAAAADLGISKSISADPAPRNGEVTYTVTAVNNGPNDATDVVVTDALPAALLNPVTPDDDCTIDGGTLTCNPGDLPNGESVEYTVTGTIDPAAGDDVITNTAEVAASQADPNPENDSTSIDTPLSGDGSVELTKIADAPSDTNGDGMIGAGDEIDYHFTVGNTGDTTLNEVTIDDPLLGGTLDCPALEGVTLAPGAEVDCGPIAYVLSQDDVDTGQVENTASVVADSPQGQLEDEASTTTVIPAVDGISLEKTGGVPRDVDGDGALGAGDAIDYVFTVTNTGTTTLDDAVIEDPLLGGVVTCAELDGVSLAPGDSITCSPVTYTVSQEDVDGGAVHNEAAVTADSPSGVATDDAEANTTVNGSDGVSLLKSAGELVDVDEDGRYGAGDQIDYSFTVRNIGTTTLTVDFLDDPLLGGEIDCPAAVGAAVAPGESVECGPVTYTLTQSDIDNGRVDNTASVTASGSSVVEDASSVEVAVEGETGVSLTKTAGSPGDTNEDGMIGAGDEIAYTFTVENTGTTSLTGATVTDPLLGGAVDCPALEEATIAPGDSVECGPLGYALTQDDVDAGLVHNDATVSASAGENTVEDQDVADMTVLGTSAINLVKTAGVPTDTDGDGRIGAGDEIDYSFTVTNSGTTTVTELGITDDLLGGALECPGLDEAVLAPGDQLDCGPVAYTLTQHDVDAGQVENTATASGSSPGGPVGDTSGTTTSITAAHGISLAKSAGEPQDADGDGVLGAGDTIEYTFSATNTGTSSLSDVVVTDPMLGGAVTCSDAEGAEVAPGDTVTCEPVTYELTQEDLDGGVVHNEATVMATSPGGTVEDGANVDVDIDGAGAIHLEKTAGAVTDTTGDGVIGAGDEVTYSFTVGNIGTTTLDDLALDDPLLGGGLECPDLDGAELAPGEEFDCGPFTYTLTQADVDSGLLHNEASVSAQASVGPVTDESSTDVVIEGAGSIDLDKTGAPPNDTNGDGVIGSGDEIAYSFTVTNGGTTVVDEIVIDDPMLGGTLDCPNVTGASLAPGESVTCGPVAYTMTQEDVDAQGVLNEASASGSSSAGDVEAKATAEVVVPGSSGIELVKSAGKVVEANGNDQVDAGDTIEYSFAVTNTGTTTLTDVAVDDPRIDGEVTCEAEAIAPGDMVLCQAPPVSLTTDEIAAGEIVNTATATAAAPDGERVEATDSVTTPLEVQPSVAVEKTAGDYRDADGDAQASAGDTIQFRFTVTNDGVVPLRDVSLDDPKLGGDVACEVPDLAPGESFECGPLEYAISSDEAKERSVTNAVTVSAMAGSAVVTGSDSVTVELPEGSELPDASETPAASESPEESGQPEPPAASESGEASVPPGLSITGAAPWIGLAVLLIGIGVAGLVISRIRSKGHS
ncbi:DUF11 domain-containing protein [Cellulosimicrobium funkei]|nr:DUF11 domain-containing protein [Cellulosimicrobium funkei]